MAFTLPSNGRNLSGIDSHVFRPIMTTLLCVLLLLLLLKVEVTVLKNCMSVGSRHGKLLPLPMPFCAVAATMTENGGMDSTMSWIGVGSWRWSWSCYWYELCEFWNLRDAAAGRSCAHEAWKKKLIIIFVLICFILKTKRNFAIIKQKLMNVRENASYPNYCDGRCLLLF